MTNFKYLFLELLAHIVPINHSIKFSNTNFDDTFMQHALSTFSFSSFACRSSGLCTCLIFVVYLYLCVCLTHTSMPSTNITILPQMYSHQPLTPNSAQVLVLHQHGLLSAQPNTTSSASWQHLVDKITAKLTSPSTYPWYQGLSQVLSSNSHHPVCNTIHLF